MKNIFMVIAFLTALSVHAADQAKAPEMKDGVLVDSKGMSLYTFDNDQANSGKSVCVEACAKNWPALMAPATAKANGDYSVITRDNGKQWAYKGKPLYLWSKDQKPGDKTGDGFKNVWHLAK